MTTECDWRLRGQERWLRGAVLLARDWRPPGPGWDQDHCVFCWTKFSLREDDAHRGWTTEDREHWICVTCFADFRERFGWGTRGEP